MISSPPLPHNRRNKHTHILDDLFWVGFWKGGSKGKKTKNNTNKKKTKKHSLGRPTLGWGKGRRLSNALFFAK